MMHTDLHTDLDRSDDISSDRSTAQLLAHSYACASMHMRTTAFMNDQESLEDPESLSYTFYTNARQSVIHGVTYRRSVCMGPSNII